MTAKPHPATPSEMLPRYPACLLCCPVPEHYPAFPRALPPEGHNRPAVVDEPLAARRLLTPPPTPATLIPWSRVAGSPAPRRARRLMRMLTYMLAFPAVSCCLLLVVVVRDRWRSLTPSISPLGFLWRTTRHMIFPSAFKWRIGVGEKSSIALPPIGLFLRAHRKATPLACFPPAFLRVGAEPSHRPGAAGKRPEPAASRLSRSIRGFKALRYCGVFYVFVKNARNRQVRLMSGVG